MTYRMNKNVSRRVPVRRPQEETDAEDLAYWLSKSPEERVEAVSVMSRHLYFLQHGRDWPRLDKTISRRVPRNGSGK